MDATIFRVAKAIYEGRNGRGCRPWANLPSSHQHPYLNDARVALAALSVSDGSPSGSRPKGLIEDDSASDAPISPNRGRENE